MKVRNTNKRRKSHKETETITLITSGGKYLGNSSYLYRHNFICNNIRNFQTNSYKPYYKYKAQLVLENDYFRIYYDRPDFMVLNKTYNKIFLIDDAYLNNNNLLDKQAQYEDVAIEFKQM